MKIAYVRVSTADQNEARQVEALKKYDIERWYTEKISGKNTDRPRLQEMLDFVREGDEIYIHDFSRLARSTKDLLDIIERLETRGVKLISNKENLDSHTPTGKLMLIMIGAIAEFERANILERQREGIIIAKREGRMGGRRPAAIPEDVWKETLALYQTREITKTEFARRIGVSRPTLDKLLKAAKNT